MRFALVTLLLASSAAADEPVYPGKQWAQRTPAQVGLDADKLKEVGRFAGGRGCVVRNGYLVYTWGDASRRRDVASAAKPFYAHFLFKAIEDGKIEGLDERLAKWEPRLKSINKPLGFKDRDIAWRHVASQTSCYQLVEKPGTAYAYNDWQMALFWDTLFLKVYGATYKNVDEKVFGPLLTGPLQCEDKPTLMAFGTRDRAGRVAISPRDFARFGLLNLRGGKWNGKQLLSEKHAKLAVTSPLPNSIPRAGRKVAEMIPGQRSLGSTAKPDNQTDHLGSYSFTWWTNGVDRDDKRHWPDVPHDAYGCFGHGGPRAMVVIPSLDLIISWNDTRIRGRERENEALKRLVQSVVKKVGWAPLTTWRTALVGNAHPMKTTKTFPKWSKIELTFSGPDSKGRGEPNPFAVVFDVEFTSPSGKRHLVPGFYNGDGKGGPDGNVWVVRFSADEEGEWSFTTKSKNAQLNGKTGRFTATAVPPNATGFFKWGRMESVGTAKNKIRYLKFRDGPYWLKAGCDDPENFLGNYKNYNTLAKRKAAIDFLAERGVNSLYIMTHNIGGDDNDVWPWLGRSPREAQSNGGRNARFDVAKLEQWRELFEYMQARGVVPYLVLEDDSAWKNYDHARYYRELIARFGDLPGLIFNFNEEHNENYRLAQALDYMRQLKEIDPYDHPRGIHNVNRPSNEYIDSPHVDFTAIQTGSPGSRRGLEKALEHNRMTIDWINRCVSQKRRVLVVNFDEARPEEDRRGWWSVYLGGGVWETHVRQPHDRPLSAWEPAWTELGGARRFMESVPFWEMQPANDLVLAGKAFCLAKPGEAYAFYLPTGGSVRAKLAEGVTYNVSWWRATNGWDGKFSNERKVVGGRREFTSPAEGKADWALRIVKAE